MLAGIYCVAYLVCGVCITRFLLPRHRPLDRMWLGLSLGLLLMMWLPALCAFVLKFSMAAHWAALALLAAVTGGCYAARDKRPCVGWDAEETRQLRLALLLTVPLTVFSGYLQYTHVIRAAADGSLHVGQSTYGDLPMHLSFITSLVNSPFPPDYPFFPGTQLSYPFLTDSLSTSFYMMGWSLQTATAIPATLMMGLCFLGVTLLARQMTLGKKTIVLAALLFFFNGGLGFLYDFDQAAGLESDGSLTVWSRIQNILTGWYKTPTNQPEPNNLRWSNVIADLMVPQRTLLGGWTMVFPCFYLLYTTFDPRKRQALGGTRPLVLLGVWGGLLPLIHTHSFLALGLCTAGMLVYDLVRDEEKKAQLKRYAVFGILVLVLAAPQLFGFTFAQVSTAQTGTTNHFLRFQFNWVNNPDNSGMRDFYLWFYIKNIGLPVIALLCALCERDARKSRLFAGAFAIILAAELIRFQPNEYDNNKLFYLAYLLCVMIVSDWAAKLWRRLKGLNGRWVLAVLTTVCLFLSPVLTLWREVVSDHEAFSAGAVETAEYIKSDTEEHAVFLTGTQHLNPVASLAGRTVVCGPDLWLYWHGVDTSKRKADVAAFFADPTGRADVLQTYDVDYIYVSGYERNDYDIDMDALYEAYEVVFDNDEAVILKVAQG